MPFSPSSLLHHGERAAYSRPPLCSFCRIVPPQLHPWGRSEQKTFTLPSGGGSAIAMTNRQVGRGNRPLPSLASGGAARGRQASREVAERSERTKHPTRQRRGTPSKGMQGRGQNRPWMAPGSEKRFRREGEGGLNANAAINGICGAKRPMPRRAVPAPASSQHGRGAWQASAYRGSWP